MSHVFLKIILTKTKLFQNFRDKMKLEGIAKFGTH